MKTIYVLYNPLSGNNNKQSLENNFKEIYREDTLEFISEYTAKI